MSSFSYAAVVMLQDDPDAAVRAELQDAVDQVKTIVNQPVDAYPRTPGVQVGTYSPGWFHEGAIKPDFNHVDVRDSQDLKYGKHAYVTSNLNSGLMFKGDDCEFNPMTKWAYADRTLPKKHLTDAEMVEVNRLYRVIGADIEKLAATPQGVVIEGLPAIQATAPSNGGWMSYAPYAGGGLALVLILILVLRRNS